MWSWVISEFPLALLSTQKLIGAAVQLLSGISLFILGAKVRSRALLFLYKLFFQLVYHVFYRNLVRASD